MILDSYYRFRKTACTKTRYNLEAFANEYEPLHQPLDKSGKIGLYLSNPTFLNRPKAGKRVADFALNRASRNISSVYCPDLDNPSVGFGDIYHTEDAAVFVIRDGLLEVFIAKGKKSHAHTLWLAFVEGDLSDEVDSLKRRAEAVEGLVCRA